MRNHDILPFEALGSSPNTDLNSPNTDGNISKSVGLYDKCLDCPDYGVSCNGPKLAALGDIMVVRDFHRAIRDRRKIPMKLIHLAASAISEYTVNDYFSHSEKDFKWTTVGVIDNALTAICGNRIGQPLLDNPCPASSSEIQQQKDASEKSIADLESRCAALQAKLEMSDTVREKALEEQGKAHEKTVFFLKDLADKRYAILLRRERVILILAIICAFCFIGFCSYLVWDIMHPGMGIFR